MFIHMHWYEVIEAMELYLSKNLGADRKLFSVTEVNFEHVKLTIDEATGKTNTSDRQIYELDNLSSLILDIEELPRED